MSKYNAAKFLKETKSRMSHICDSCGKEIKKGEMYYPESMGKINAIGIKLRKFCAGCFAKHGEALLGK